MERSAVPPPPESLDETGLPEELVAGLLLKTLHARGALLGFGLSDALALPLGILDDVLVRLQERRMVEVRGTRGPGRGEFVFGLTATGRARATEELEVSRYVGPAPVPFDDYRHWVERQTMARASVARDELERALEGVVVPDELVELIGPAVNSGKSLFLYGDSGNGKTLLAERLARVFGQRYFVPHAVLLDDAVMVVHDPAHHHGAATDDPPEGTGSAGDSDGAGPRRAASEEPSPRSDLPEPAIVRSLPDHDRRFAPARRPVVTTGGELTLDQLDLRWDPTGRMYQAPPQLKACGGVLVVDDLGRQRVPPRELLNRWIVPLERRHDHLTLRSGKTIVVPFDCLVIFSTNLDPTELADEAFLRRIHYKIEVPGPNPARYEEIFRQCCEERGIEYREDAVDFLFAEVYEEGSIEPRSCHPRDVLDHLCDLAGYRGVAPELCRELVAHACRTYFVSPG